MYLGTFVGCPPGLINEYDNPEREISNMNEKEAWKIPSPRDYLAIKYSAPPGTCKCGECQLVPPEMLNDLGSRN